MTNKQNTKCNHHFVEKIEDIKGGLRGIDKTIIIIYCEKCGNVSAKYTIY